ncbi:MAG: hypothetical protein ACRBCK_09390 [Alphaproteobacteria bacterium]
MTDTARTIEKTIWKDQSFREIAKTYAADKKFDKAVTVITEISNQDTKAMTIRGIGMAIAAIDYTKAEHDTMFQTLRTEAEKLDHPPSYAIALTYIAMAQAFAGDNDGAWKTASDMKNHALRNKAYGETAEIQAEKGDYKSAQVSIERIDSLAFRNKAYSIVSKILADNARYTESYAAATAITNAYKRTGTLQYMLDKQSPRETKN